MPYFKAKCTEFDFRWGSAPDPSLQANSIFSDLLAGFKGHTSKGMREREGSEEHSDK